jgi:RNA polymerase sigma factor (TIGR02999 family)
VAESAAITRLLEKAQKGDRAAEEQLIRLVYPKLRRLAQGYLRGERPGHTLQATALVHEAYIDLLPQRVSWQSRSHFFGIAAQQMRRILLDYARARKARGGDKVRYLDEQADNRDTAGKSLRLEDVLAMAEREPEVLIAVHEALNRLASDYPRQAQVVELRFFGERTEDEIRQILGVSVETVKRDWKFAKAWLNQALRDVGRR